MKKQRLVILGGGESGVGAARLGIKENFEVFLSDKGKIKEKYKDVLSHLEVQWEEGKHSEELIFNADIVVKSPGIPDEVPMIVKLREQGIPVISEIEFAGKFSKAKMICITGSNGKTTTAKLTHYILDKAGLDVGLAGNVGDSLAAQVADHDREFFVVELSSFQLDGMYDFKAHIAILLNITPDHLDRYGNDFSRYVDSKFRIIQNLTESDYFIYFLDDEAIKKKLKTIEVKAKQYPFSLNRKVDEGAYLEANNINININHKTFNMSIFDFALQGKHNAANAMAAALPARIFDLRKEVIRECLSDFQNVEHRLEFVAKIHGITFINDSKATNVNSTWYALESMEDEGQTIWIAGGVDKGNDYSMLEELVRDRVKAIICLGEDNSKIHEAFGGIVDTIVDAKSAKEAVGLSYRLASKGETVLLSPACASFDLFDNYEERGRLFKEAVRQL